MTRALAAIFDSPNAFSRRPAVNSYFESNVPGLFVVGDLSGAPVVKLAMEQGHRVATHIAKLYDAHAIDPGALDVVVIGAGAAGLSAALTLQERGLRVLVLEKAKLANTIDEFPEGKWIYAEPDSRAPEGKLWLAEGASKEDLLARWREAVAASRLDVRTGAAVTAVAMRDGYFDVKTERETHRARRVILATGQRGNPRWLGVPGEDRARVYHRLYTPGHHRGEDIVVAGGGNSAVEAALALAEAGARVTLVHRGAAFERVFKANARQLAAAERARRLTVLRGSRVTAFGERTCTVNGRELPCDHAFVLIGADPPVAFLRSLGLRLENDWTGNPWIAAALTFGVLGGIAWFWPVALLAVIALVWSGVRGNRFAWLGVSFLAAYTIYGAKVGPSAEFWPYRGWGYNAFSFFDRPIGFWYTVAYTAVMTVFGIRAVKRWGFDKNDRFQIWRYASLIGFQWIFFFLIPEFLFQYAVKYEWVGELAKDPTFASAAWRSYGLVYAWPLFFFTFFDSPHQIWSVWGVLLAFVIIPVLALFHGKRYCSWICGCGGLAETLGDRWRHLSPKGSESIRWEWMNIAVLIVASIITIATVVSDVRPMLREGAGLSRYWYRLIVDVWLVGIIPITLYPFLGGKVWCRYWCPLARMMQIFSAAFTRFKASRFAIRSNDKCIACGECTRYCQVGIDVMNYALTQRVLDNANSSCIGCGICVTACPMGVLSFGVQTPAAELVQIR